MKVDFGPLERTSKRKLRVSLTFWGGFVTPLARTSSGVEVRAPRSPRSFAARGARTKRRTAARDRPRTRPLDRDGSLLAAPVGHPTSGRAPLGGRSRDRASRGHACVSQSWPAGLAARPPRDLPLRALRARAGRGAETPGEADPRRGGGRLLFGVRLRRLLRRTPVPSCRSLHQGVRAVARGCHARDRACARGGQKVRSPVRELPRGGGSRSPRASGSPGWIRTTKN